MILVALLVLASVQVALFEEYIIPDNIDIDDILKNDRLLKNYVNCVLDKGNCTPEGERLKKAIPESLQNGCSKCNDKVKEGTKKVIHHLIEKKPDMWKELEARYDPNGDYKKKYKDLIEKEGLAI
ncbi:hypothetical protein MTP99_001271 [Tenebrio molitor]|jgi:hypothetical protein|uniref:Chemosensory protein CSP5 mRNA n=1 Tax=Tenebrio molitor TaxID=7067 RepID=A0A0C5D1H6_TENMO|nr:chemosensory protein CSP5 [Tenebrio molitor]KAH0815022.1 hypothetical protein GEV33_007769 [Tenebrio molitor]KAJ3637847.1 hypothetical protein MTP99_001271 [Tenebrio molitor]CAH1364951.1 unnamed protein product [Tenebrio molitor]